MAALADVPMVARSGDSRSSVYEQDGREPTDFEIRTAQAYVRSKRPNVLICTPAYGGMEASCFSLSRSRITMLFDKFGIGYQISITESESHIDRARNRFAFAFEQATPFTHLFFLDADIELIQPFDAIRLLVISDEVDVVGCGYPIKGLDETRGIELCTKHGLSPLRAMMRYTGNIVSGQKKRHSFSLTGALWGFTKVDEIATGCMMINRRAFRRIRSKLTVPEQLPVYAPYPEGHRAMGMTSPCKIDDFLPMAGFFASRASQTDGIGKFLSEDYAFCERVRQAGGSIGLMTTATVLHTGSHMRLTGRFVNQILCNQLMQNGSASDELLALASPDLFLPGSELSRRRSRVIAELKRDGKWDGSDGSTKVGVASSSGPTVTSTVPKAKAAAEIKDGAAAGGGGEREESTTAGDATEEHAMEVCATEENDPEG